MWKGGEIMHFNTSPIPNRFIRIEANYLEQLDGISYNWSFLLIYSVPMNIEGGIIFTVSFERITPCFAYLLITYGWLACQSPYFVHDIN